MFWQTHGRDQRESSGPRPACQRSAPAMGVHAAPRASRTHRIRRPSAGAVVRLFADTVLGWYRRRMELADAPGGRGGAITVGQRVRSDLRCNPHIHAIFIDGVFVPEGDGGKPSFHPLPQLSDTAVADVLQISRTRILKFLVRRGVVDVSDDAVTVTDDLADRDPVLAALASASVYGLPPAGPARRKPTLIALGGHGGHAEPTIKSSLCIDHAGFGLHCRLTCTRRSVAFSDDGTKSSGLDTGSFQRRESSGSWAFFLSNTFPERALRMPPRESRPKAG